MLTLIVLHSLKNPAIVARPAATIVKANAACSPLRYEFSTPGIWSAEKTFRISVAPVAITLAALTDGALVASVVMM